MFLLSGNIYSSDREIKLAKKCISGGDKYYEYKWNRVGRLKMREEWVLF